MAELPPMHSLTVRVEELSGGTQVILEDPYAGVSGTTGDPSEMCVIVLLEETTPNPSTTLPPQEPPPAELAWIARGCAPYGDTGPHLLDQWSDPWMPLVETQELTLGPLVAYQASRAVFDLVPPDGLLPGTYPLKVIASSGRHNWMSDDWGTDTGYEKSNFASARGQVVVAG
jgi:hypothetical protein